MNKAKNKILEEFENKFGLSSLYAQPTDYMNYEEVYDNVTKFLSEKIDEYVDQVLEEILPDEKDQVKITAPGIYAIDSWNACRQEISDNWKEIK